jgi:hypothetical protein
MSEQEAMNKIEELQMQLFAEKKKQKEAVEKLNRLKPF